MNFTFVKKILNTKTYSLKAGLATDWFEVDNRRLVFVESGSAIYSIANKTYEVNKGDLILLGLDLKRIRCLGEEPFEISIIFFEDTKDLKPAPLLSFGRESGSYGMLKEMFFEIHGHQNENFHLELLNCLLHIFLRDRGNNESGDGRIRQALQIIRRQKGWRLTSEQMASAVGLSRAHFNLLFKEETGLAYATLCRKARMETALTLMQEYGLSAKEAAFEIGSSSSQAFSREFKAFYGRPPAAFRNLK